MHSKPSAVGDRSTVFDTKFHIGFDFAITRSCSGGLSCCISFFDSLRGAGRAEMAGCNLCTVHVDEQKEKVIPLFKNEIARDEDVGKLVLGEKVLRL